MTSNDILLASTSQMPATKISIEISDPPPPFEIPHLPSFNQSRGSTPTFGISEGMSAPSAPKMITNVASRRIRSQSLSLPDVEGFDDDGGGCTPAPFDLDLPPPSYYLNDTPFCSDVNTKITSQTIFL